MSDLSPTRGPGQVPVYDGTSYTVLGYRDPTLQEKRAMERQAGRGVLVPLPDKSQDELEMALRRSPQPTVRDLFDTMDDGGNEYFEEDEA